MEGSLLPDLPDKEYKSTSSNFHIHAPRSPKSKTFKGSASQGFHESAGNDADALQRRSLNPVGSTFFLKRPKPKRNNEKEENPLRKQSVLRVPKAGSFHVAKSSRYKHDNTLQKVSSDDASLKRTSSFKGSLHSAMKAMRVLPSSPSNRSDSLQQKNDADLAAVVFPTYVETENKGKAVKSQNENISPCGLQSTNGSKSTHSELRNGPLDTLVPSQESENIMNRKNNLACLESIVVSIETDDFNLDDSNDLRVGTIDSRLTDTRRTVRNGNPWGIPDDESDKGPSSVTWKKSPANESAKSDKNASSFKGLLSPKKNQASARGSSLVGRMSFKAAPKVEPKIAMATARSNLLLQECIPSQSNDDNDSCDENSPSLRSDESISDFSRRVSIMYDPFVDLQSKSKQNENRSMFERLILKAKEKKQRRDNDQDGK